VSRVIGIDFGRQRVGVAISDPLRMTARPLEVVPGSEAVARVARLADEYGVTTIVVGIPNPLRGGESESSLSARRLGEELAEATGARVEYVDERYTSKMADEALLESGMKRRPRRDTVDKVAAAIILQTYLDGNSRIDEDVEDPGAK
jgi:putative Holliday junction resolvase